MRPRKQQDRRRDVCDELADMFGASRADVVAFVRVALPVLEGAVAWFDARRLIRERARLLSALRRRSEIA